MCSKCGHAPTGRKTSGLRAWLTRSPRSTRCDHLVVEQDALADQWEYCDCTDKSHH
ncbi:hypothetical protein [Subtercola endophyticus]|uniref:hypothetical protein n=1 Tax=Subtercola endophyticus TaxID=2895559 RepID=UPI001E429661|nr:hypothetical protein [Subtercola endophyticus]UFS59459.1 hypothetical protein LQ955_01270 [Subtercola endophyticus]